MMMPSHSSLFGHLPISPEMMANQIGLVAMTVADNPDDFRRAAADPENSDYWFGAVLVDRLRAAGKMLLPFECYSYITLPILGGKYTPDNFVIYPVVRHFRTWGPISWFHTESERMALCRLPSLRSRR